MLLGVRHSAVSLFPHRRRVYYANEMVLKTDIGVTFEGGPVFSHQASRNALPEMSKRKWPARRRKFTLGKVRSPKFPVREVTCVVHADDDDVTNVKLPSLLYYIVQSIEWAI